MLENQSRLHHVEPPTRKSRLEMYLWDNGSDIAMDLAESFHDPSKPLAKFGVHVPVAAHQDVGSIMHSMSQYAGQEGAEPFSILLYLNSPFDAGPNGIDQSVEEISKAKLKYPQLDIRWADTAFLDKPTIGQIRKDLWDGAATLALSDGLYDDPDSEYIGINHDIDTVHISPHYMRNVQNYYRDYQARLDYGEGKLMKSRYTQVKHHYPFDTHPNIAKALFWVDMAFRQTGRQGCYEEGIVIPMSQYATLGGFDDKSPTHETKYLVPRDNEGIPGTSMDTSPRRYLARLAEHGFGGIWTDESFTAYDQCRDPNLNCEDISFDQLEDLIFDTFDRYVGFYLRAVPASKWQALTYRQEGTFGLQSVLSPAELRETVRAEFKPRLNVARNVLQRVVGSDTLAQLVDDKLLDQMANEYAEAIDSLAGTKIILKR